MICAALVYPIAAQTIPSPTGRLTPQTVEAALAIEDPAARIAALRQILKTRPATEQADAAREAIVASWAQLGEAQLNENNIEKAAANFRQAVASLPEKITDKFFAETVIRIPLAVSVRGYRNEAIELARLLEKQFAAEVLRLAALGEFFMTVEAPADAIRSLEAASKLSEGAGAGADGPLRGQAPLHCALGAAYRMGLRLDDAIAEYQLAIGADPKDKRAYYELANLYRAHGAYADAVKLYQKQLEIEPKHAPALKGLALSHLARGNEDRMTAALNRARDLRGSAEEVTGDIYLQTQMAFYYLKQNKLKQARAAAEAALVVEPRYAWARIAAAEVDLAEGKIFEAERSLLAAQRYAGFPTLLFTFGKLYLSVEDFDGALEQFAKAFSFSGSSSANLSPKGLFATRLGGSLEVKAAGLEELLSREHQASIFIAESPTQPEQFKLIESLVRFSVWLSEIRTITAAQGTVTRKQMEELDRAALDFVEAESTRRSFRSLYVARKLSQAGVATGLAVELAEQALGLAEAATELDGSLKDYPNYDRSGRLQIFRGRALDAKGWALYKAGQNEEAAAALSEAAKTYGSLPEGKQALWHLAAVKETIGESNAALDLYLAGYQPPENLSADMRLAVIEVLYRKINGSRNGLDERLRRALGLTQAEVNAMLNALSRSQPIATTPSTPAKSQSRRARAAEQINSKESSDALRAGGTAKPPVPTETVTRAAGQPTRSQPADAAATETKQPANDNTTSEAPSGTKPVELPDISVSFQQPVMPPARLGLQTLPSPREAIKANIAAEEDAPPPPPAKTHTRPRRVSDPKDSTPSRQQEPEPIRLRRPPKPNN